MLARIPRAYNPNVLVGFDTSDDAGVYLIADDLALVQTVDFFTPIVDDPFTFGAIAAANSLSDVYAMGGTPISALSILAYPAKGDLDDLHEILRGGASQMAAAGCAILGGHSIADDEIKFGYAVTGRVHPQRIWANSTARAGDALVFTKRLGTGVIATALKRGIVAAGHLEQATASMMKLNREAYEALSHYDVHGCTDVTGFGLLGHAREMAVASNVTLEIEVARVQFLPGAAEYAAAGAIPGGLRNNREFVADCVAAETAVPEHIEHLLYDPQTSGGLLASLSTADAEEVLRELPDAYLIGRVTARSAKPIVLR